MKALIDGRRLSKKALSGFTSATAVVGIGVSINRMSADSRPTLRFFGGGA